MNVDSKIKAILEKESDSVDQILVDDEGLFDLVKGSYKGGMRRWIFVSNFVIFAVTALMLWTGYEFFTATDVEGYSFWGICLLLSTYCQVAMKQWVWTEMNRCSLMREIKRLELALEKMSQQQSKTA